MLAKNRSLNEIYYKLLLNSPQMITMDIPLKIGKGNISQTKIKHGVILADWKMCYESDMNVQGPVSNEYIQIIFCLNDGISWGMTGNCRSVSIQKNESCIYTGHGGIEYICYKKDSEYSFKSIKIPLTYFKHILEEYFEKCELLRMYFSDPALTTDVIVGFPGETEEEFAQSRAFVDKVNFYETHIFKYSKRAGTKAAEMKNQVPEEIKAARSSELLALGRQKERAYEEKLIGRTVEVLIEERAEREDGIYQVGHTKEYVKIGLKTSENLENQLINVEIENRLQIIH